jgi:hypothetical protein
MNGVEWNTMEPIPSHTIQSSNFLSPPNWGVCNGMRLHHFNITCLPLFLYYRYFHLLLLYIIFFFCAFLLSLCIFMCVCVFAWVYYFLMEWSLINFYHANMFHLLSILHVYVVWFRKLNLLWLLLETIIVRFFFVLWYYTTIYHC